MKGSEEWGYSLDGEEFTLAGTRHDAIVEGTEEATNTFWDPEDGPAVSFFIGREGEEYALEQACEQLWLYEILADRIFEEMPNEVELPEVTLSQMVILDQMVAEVVKRWCGEVGYQIGWRRIEDVEEVVVEFEMNEDYDIVEVREVPSEITER